ncbi:MAG TPA: ATP-binding cassette domain-containing protein [Acidimicrobiales bacterium]|nr:ATP-binding cassette domain-containing protein [Acidimicrobiales bacterium]
MTSAIEAEKLEKTFGGEVRALDGVSFTVEKGTVFGLLGPNGAGKTTAVRILTTIIGADGGHGRVLGHDVATEAPVVRRLIGLAGQNAAVDEYLTGLENLKMVGRLNRLSHEVVAQRAGELLEQFGLVDAAHRPLKTYSGGMRRRLDVAAALVARPPVLFLDEPTTGLDPHSRSDLWEMIETLVGEGTTVLLTTQYLEEADRLATRVAVVDHGQVIAEGTPEQLKSNMGATFVDVGMADSSAAALAAQVLTGAGTKSPSVVGSMVEIPVDDGPRAAMEVLRLLDQHHMVPTIFRLREPSLDDVFLSLTGRPTDEGTPDIAADGAEANGSGGRRRSRRRRASGAASMPGPDGAAR